MPTELADVLAKIDASRGDAIDRLVQWLRIPSVSTDPAYAEQCAAAANWAAEHLRASGLEAELMATGTAEAPGHPIVLGRTPNVGDAGAGPHVLFYGHYDVQPADPIELWDRPPFEPAIVDDRIVARGACDDKGQVATFLESLRAWYEASDLAAGGARFTVLLEGEEESGSVNLDRFVAEHAELFEDCDVCLISDTGMLGPNQPAITYGVRGLCYTEVTLVGPDQDLHSGMWGGRVLNPLNELSKILAQLWDEDRRVTLPGFYDSVRELEQSERNEWAALDIDNATLLKTIGLPPEADRGEAGYTLIEREWARPTADINGLFGGYTGAGAKTVIPSRATAKVSFRLVADQDPEAVERSFFEWLEERTPAGFRWELVSHGGGWPATVATDSPLLAATRRALAVATPEATPALIKSGGSIPVAGLLKRELGLETIFMGFGLDDDRVHSPNEKFDLACFDLGTRSHAAFIAELLAMRDR